MGGSCSSVETDEVTKMLDAQLRLDNERNKMHFKILCLGAGESGKSTVIKQLNKLYVKNTDALDPKDFVQTLRNNALESMNVFIRAAGKFKLKFTDEELKCADSIRELQKSHGPELPPESADWMEKIRGSEAFTTTWARKNEFWHLEASKYFFDNFKRFAADGFLPTDEDIIFARQRTTGVIETTFDKFDIKWTVVDVGGQRNERRKWIHCFDDVHAILYVVNLAGYCKVLFEDETVNRMVEELNLFKSTVGNKTFAKTPITILLNKKDLFEDLVKNKIPLNTAFPEYDGGDDTMSNISYVADEFQKRLTDVGKEPAHIHYIASRFKRDVKVAFEELRDSLLKRHAVTVSKAKSNTAKLEKTQEKLIEEQHERLRLQIAASRQREMAQQQKAGAEAEAAS